MKRTVELFLDNRPIGSVTRQRDSRFVFEYEPAYRANATHHPLSLSLPLTAAAHHDTRNEPVVANYLWRLLPDDREVIRRYGRHFEVPDNDPLALLEAIGEDCPGAVSFGAPDTARDMAPLDEAAMADIVEGLRRGRTPDISGSTRLTFRKTSLR